MKVKLSEIVNNVEAINSLSEVKLPIKVSYRIKRLAGKLAPILDAYNEKRDALIKELGEANEKGGFSVKDPEKLKVFSERLQELLSFEEEVDFTKIKLSELGEVSLSPNELPEFIFEE